MAVLELRFLGDEVLRQRAVPVKEVDDEIRRLVRDMFDTMYHAEGIGLAAPQVGVGLRVIVVDLREEEHPPFALINPEIVTTEGVEVRSEEGCLSIPGMTGVVPRPERVVVEGLRDDGTPLRIEAGDLLGRCLQHEVDHLNGVLFPDRMSPLSRNMLLRKWRKSKQEAL